MSKYSDVATLKMCQRDLKEDSGELGTLTRRLEQVGDGYRKLISHRRTEQVIGQVAALQEPAQVHDPDLSQARDALDREILELRREIEAEEEAARQAELEAAKVLQDKATGMGGGISGGGSGGGGGGSF